MAVVAVAKVVITFMVMLVVMVRLRRWLGMAESNSDGSL